MFDLVGWIVVSGPGGIVANLRGDETGGQDMMPQIIAAQIAAKTGANIGADCHGAA